MNEKRDYWSEHREEYASVPGFVELAEKKHQQYIDRMMTHDPLRGGINVGRGEEGFDKLEALAKEAFGDSGIIAAVILIPDPWTGSGLFLIHISLEGGVGMEKKIHVSQAIKHLS